MANYCSSSFTIYGSNQRAILKYYLEMRQVIDEGHLLSARGLLTKLGCIPKLIEKMDGRTTIEDIRLQRDSLGQSSVVIETESAWTTCEVFILATIRTILKDDVNDIHECFVAEECGMNYYVCSDGEGKYYPARYRVGVYDNDMDDIFYYTAEEEGEFLNLIDRLSNVKLKSAKDLRDGKIYEEIQDGFYSRFLDDEGADYYLNIGLFDIVGTGCPDEEAIPTLDQLLSMSD